MNAVSLSVSVIEATMEPTPDAILMARTKEGDLDAFGDLVERHRNTVINYLTHMTRDRDRAEELAQEAFLRLYEKRALYRERGQLMAYVLRIATNLLRSEERRKKRWRGLIGIVTADTERRPSDPGPQRLILSDEATRRVGEALDELAPIYRAPLVLREIEGLSYQEIARALSCRVGTIKSRINRGRRQLKVVLEPYWNGESA